MKKQRYLKVIKYHVPCGFYEHLLVLAVVFPIQQFPSEDFKVIPNTKALHMKAFQT